MLAGYFRGTVGLIFDNFAAGGVKRTAEASLTMILKMSKEKKETEQEHPSTRQSTRQIHSRSWLRFRVEEAFWCKLGLGTTRRPWTEE